MKQERENIVSGLNLNILKYKMNSSGESVVLNEDGVMSIHPKVKFRDTIPIVVEINKVIYVFSVRQVNPIVQGGEVF